MTLRAAAPNPAVDQPAERPVVGGLLTSEDRARRQLHFLDESMTRAEVARVLERLSFRDGSCLLSLGPGRPRLLPTAAARSSLNGEYT